MRKSNGMIQKIIDGRANNYEIDEWLEYVDSIYLDKMIGMSPNLDYFIMKQLRKRKLKKLNENL